MKSSFQETYGLPHVLVILLGILVRNVINIVAFFEKIDFLTMLFKKRSLTLRLIKRIFLDHHFQILTTGRTQKCIVGLSFSYGYLTNHSRLYHTCDERATVEILYCTLAQSCFLTLSCDSATSKDGDFRA